MLSAKYNGIMNTHQIAQVLGSRGGKKRAKNLSAEQKQNIARLGGLAKKQSQLAAQRVAANFDYLATVRILAPKRKPVKREATCKTRLPGIYL